MLERDEVAGVHRKYDAFVAAHVEYRRKRKLVDPV
jgi:hypothetical protein